MFRNYFISALRNMTRNRIQTLIQVVSLAIGITAAISIGLYIQHEFSYDQFNEKLDRIYRVEFGNSVGQYSAIGNQIKQEIPEVENVVRIANFGGKDRVFTSGYMPSEDSADLRFIEVGNQYWCDSTIFDVFTIPLIQGDPATALKDPSSCVVSESTARRIFGERDPMGESLWEGSLTITGVFKDIERSHIDIDMMLSMIQFDSLENAPRGQPGYLNSYIGRSWMTYLLLPEGTDPSYFEDRIDAFFREKWKSEFDFEPENRFRLRPLRDIYFSSNLEQEINTFNHGNLKQIRVLMLIALFILVLGIINYINLSTARASLRAREVGIRKVTGSSKKRLVFQFLTESVLITLVSFLLGLTLVQLLLPGFNRLASTDLDMQFLAMPETMGIILSSVFLLGIISGIYPALYMTGFQPVSSLAGENSTGKGSLYLRRMLLTFQFTISLVLIIGVLVIFRQLRYMKFSDPGFNRELVVNVGGSGIAYYWQMDHSKRQLIRERLLQYPDIRGVAFSRGIAGREQLISQEPYELNGIKKYGIWMGIDPDYIDLMGLELAFGRNFSHERPGDYRPYIIGDGILKILANETFIKTFKLEADAPQIITLKGRSEWQAEVIGVIEDFHFQSFHEKIQPTLFAWQEFLPSLSIRIAPQNIRKTLGNIRSELVSVFPFLHEDTFKLSFLDETYARQYFRDEKNFRIIISFAIVAVLIACMGLFGLSSFMAARRIKEIGIRKAFGASERSVFLLLSREFLRWVGLAILIACPVGWIIMDRWLQNFAYRNTIPWWIFALTILIALVITFATITWQSLKSARTNPVDSLRYE